MARCVMTIRNRECKCSALSGARVCTYSGIIGACTCTKMRFAPSLNVIAEPSGSRSSTSLAPARIGNVDAVDVDAGDHGSWQDMTGRGTDSNHPT